MAAQFITTSRATLRLAPLAEADLPLSPERAEIRPVLRRTFTLAAPTKPGVYKVTIAADGWIDVVDNGAFLHSEGFSGAVDCAGRARV